MLRRFVGCLMLFAFILQGVAQASAAAFADPEEMQGCADHQMSAGDCACCPQGTRTALDCAEKCSLATGIPTALPPPAWDPPTEYRSFAASEALAPTYLPLKPPPKS
jgi:hypothetical protein